MTIARAVRELIVAKLVLVLVAALVGAAMAAAAPSAPVSSAAASAPAWVPVPRVAGRLKSADIGLVINSADPYSVEVGEYYAQRRGLLPGQVLRVELPLREVLTPAELMVLRERIEAHFGPATQALALAWTAPSAVSCNSITGALTLGFDAALCAQTCARSRPSPYANARTSRPFRDLGLRPSMLIAARSVAQAKALIDRGVASDGQLGLRGALPVAALFVATTDSARNVRMRRYPPPGLLRQAGVVVRHLAANELGAQHDVLLALTGAVVVDGLAGLRWAPGGIGDHLTSSGGQLGTPHGQSTVLDWIESGAVASHGTVSEPCNHLQKFPHPQWLLLHYLQGATAIEAYWKSVQWPQQGLFVGEPLAAPFGRR
jgi:uncharacterized protein (TIGR03790 family)